VVDVALDVAELGDVLALVAEQERGEDGAGARCW
jgi:hypothetical protein